ncbi:DUF6580 family putative transport protein [Botrimarina hoheduenensis]|uniref:Thiamine transporter ThiT n=1 Tax=Botrimarina hoheduenensis TaxID=2528000 RepID=A0A5C5W716_9BACT|nr:DUF6580 family putative transport protein [Botrimarina hoheduenensis]TWT46686.1 hypothetical protein Pla111_17870 [Botrimarina hoheduenensis]
MRSRLPQLPAQLSVFALLVAIAVAGRWSQPDWCVTPMAAAGLLAGYWFRSVGVAVLVPLVAMAVSDLLLPAYDRFAVHAAVYGSMMVPALLGGWMRRPLDRLSAGIVRLAVSVATPSLLFFVATNFAVWASSGRYAKTLAGLGECYAAALPFYRRMLAGDAVYAALLLTVAAAAGAYSLRGERRPESTASAASTSAA